MAKLGLTTAEAAAWGIKSCRTKRT